MGILGSVLGIVVLLVIAVLFSNNRKAINLRTVLGALAIQIGFAALILYVPFGRDALQATANGVSNVIAYGNEGINFVFGGLADPSKCRLYLCGESFTNHRLFLRFNFCALLLRYHASSYQSDWWCITSCIRYIKSRIYVCCSEHLRWSNRSTVSGSSFTLEI